EDVNQSSIRMVALGATKDNPDFYAIEVFNEAFGGGFASRLFRNIRTAQGLAYSVGGGIGTGFDHPGMQRLSMGPRVRPQSDQFKRSIHRSTICRKTRSQKTKSNVQKTLF